MLTRMISKSISAYPELDLGVMMKAPDDLIRKY